MTPFLKEQIGLFNDVSKYVMGMILNHTSPEKRANSIHKFIVMSKVIFLLHCVLIKMSYCKLFWGQDSKRF